MRRIWITIVIALVGQAILPVLPVRAEQAAGQAGLPVLQIGEYIAALESIRTSVRANDATAARTQAQQLLAAGIDSPSGRFVADSVLLHAVMAAPQSSDARLTTTINALRAAAPATAAPLGDPSLIKKLRAEEAPNALQAGGEIDTAPAGDEKTLDKIANWISRAWKWVGRQLDKLANWFDRWWPRERVGNESKKKATGSARGVVIVIVAAIVVVIGILAYEVVRRSRAAMPPPVAMSDAMASKRDEDPLSRSVNEWERYAVQLAAAGRIREAIRAWFHAVLVTLYAGGILHFRKGRTNWEYIAALSPDLAWRAEFVTLTRHFEEEWYGHDRSSLEALDDFSDRAKQILESLRRRAAA